MIFIFFIRAAFAATKISIGRDEIRIFENCPNNFESFETIQFGEFGENDGLKSNLFLSPEEKSVEICCKPCCECYNEIDCENVPDLDIQEQKKEEIVDFLKRLLSWSFVEKIDIHQSCEGFFKLQKGFNDFYFSGY